MSPTVELICANAIIKGDKLRNAFVVYVRHGPRTLPLPVNCFRWIVFDLDFHARKMVDRHDNVGRWLRMGGSALAFV
jgi:hypothetical protein